MKRAWIVVVIAVAASAVVLAGARSNRMDRRAWRGAGSNWAQPQGDQYGYYGRRMGPPMRGEYRNDWGREGRMGRFEGPGRGFGPGPGAMERRGEALEALNLTDEQKEAVKALREKVQEEMKAGMAKILTKEQLAKLEKMKEKMGERGGMGGPMGMRGPGGGIGGMWHEGMGAEMILRRLDLTEEQQTKVKAICKDTKEKIEAAETPEAKGQVVKAAIEKVKGLLTDEQNQKLDKMLKRVEEHVTAMMGKGPMLARAKQIGLSDEQISKIKEIEKNTKAAIKGADSIEAKLAALETAREQVKKVLTAEQLKQIKEHLAQQRPGRGEFPGPGGFRGPRPGGRPGGFMPGRRG